MNRLLKFSVAVLTLTAVARAADYTLITHSFPPEQDIRKPDRSLAKQPAAISLLTYSPDGRLLAAASDTSVLLFEARTGEQGTGELVHSFDAAAKIISITFSPDGKILNASVGESIKAWDVATNQPAEPNLGPPTTMPAPPAIHLPETSILTVFSKKFDQVAVPAADNNINVYDLTDPAKPTLLCTQSAHTDKITAIAFNPNGQKMASADASGVINYWTTPLNRLTPADLEKIDAATPAKATATPKQPRKLLVFWRADAILHKVGVASANEMLQSMSRKTSAFTVDFSRSYDALSPELLKNYDALVLNSTAHLAIPEPAKKALLDYVKNGGNVIGFHAAIDTFKQWPEGAAIIGATFANHPWPPSGNWAVKIDDPAHPLVAAFKGRNFKMHDELYEMGEPYSRSDRRVLLSVDLSDPATANVTGLHRTDKDFALAWIKENPATRARTFYCDFGGHTLDPLTTPAIQQFYLDAIQWTLHDLEADPTPVPAK